MIYSEKRCHFVKKIIQTRHLFSTWSPAKPSLHSYLMTYTRLTTETCVQTQLVNTLLYPGSPSDYIANISLGWPRVPAVFFYMMTEPCVFFSLNRRLADRLRHTASFWRCWGLFFNRPPGPSETHCHPRVRSWSPLSECCQSLPSILTSVWQLSGWRLHFQGSPNQRVYLKCIDRSLPPVEMKGRQDHHADC